MVRQPLEQSNNLALCQFITQQIANAPDRRVTFAAYMDWVLYHPQNGYYATLKPKIGSQGDFFTAPHLGSDFGELIAEQLVQMWQLLGYPAPFTLVEMGAGQGILAQDVLRYLHQHYFECFEVVHYIIVEASSALKAEQRHHLEKFRSLGAQVEWCTWDDIPLNSIVGCCFSNELVDAFPVHQITIANSQLQEIYVTLAEGDRSPTAFAEVTGELSTPRLSQYFDLVGVPLPSDTYPDGYRTEVNLAALDWIATVAERLQRGYLLTIDYGYPAARYYSPARTQGTLQCYYQHAHHSDPYINIGHQDLTAHVDFTSLERQGERCGLQTIGQTQQGLFLMALGLGDRIADLSNPNTERSLQDILRRREALHSLANPLGMGNFTVLLQCKGLDAEDQKTTLKGLQMPSLR